MHCTKSIAPSPCRWTLSWVNQRRGRVWLRTSAQCDCLQHSVLWGRLHLLETGADNGQEIYS
eukprot:5573214-Pyramimonas_sp.AAC.1